MKSLSKIACAVALFSVATLSQATTYSNVSSASGTIIYFGAPDTTSYGEVFGGVGGTLQDFTFYTQDGNAGGMFLTVAQWDGSKAVGPALYSSAVSYGGGAQAVGASGINLALSASNSYIAYLTVAGASSPATSVSLGASSDSGNLPNGAFRFLNSNGTDPLTMNQPWSSWYQTNMTFTANVSAVPEADSYAMMLAGLAVLGAVARRKAKRG